MVLLPRALHVHSTRVPLEITKMTTHRTRDWRGRRFNRTRAFYCLLTAGSALVVGSIIAFLLAITAPLRGVDTGAWLAAAVICVIGAAGCLATAQKIDSLARRWNQITAGIDAYLLRLSTFRVARMVGTICLVAATIALVGGLYTPLHGYGHLAVWLTASVLGLAAACVSLTIASIARGPVVSTRCL